MPNRILRDWTDSETIDALDVQTERFFIRLIMKVDDYGRYLANVRLLKSQLFPLKSDIRETDISRWLAECKQSGLIALYNVAQKDYLQIVNFRQQLRQKVEKYPPPIEVKNNATQTHSRRIADDVPETKRNESETEREKKPEISPSLQNSNLFRQPTIPTIEQVEEKFLFQGGSKEMALRFFNKHSSVGWFLNGSPITNFNNLIPSFIASWNRNIKGEPVDSRAVKIKIK